MPTAKGLPPDSPRLPMLRANAALARARRAAQRDPGSGVLARRAAEAERKFQVEKILFQAGQALRAAELLLRQLPDDDGTP